MSTSDVSPDASYRVIAGSFGVAAQDEPVAQVIDHVAGRVPTHTVAPPYPRKARRDRIEGRVQVCFEIDRQGRPRRIAVRNSTHRSFERPSVKAVRASFFKPLEEGGELQSIKSCRTFIFSLEPIPDEILPAPSPDVQSEAYLP